MTCEDCLKKDEEIKKLAERISRLENTITIFGWKGKDKTEINFVEPAMWMVIEHRKDKETQEVLTSTHEIPNQNVIEMWRYLKELAMVGEPIKPLTLREHIIKRRCLQVTPDAFYGGRNRAKLYFPCLYYPLKILEYKGLIAYSGGGVVTRLSEYAECLGIQERLS